MGDVEHKNNKIRLLHLLRSVEKALKELVMILLSSHLSSIFTCLHALISYGIAARTFTTTTTFVFHGKMMQKNDAEMLAWQTN